MLRRTLSYHRRLNETSAALFPTLKKKRVVVALGGNALQSKGDSGTFDSMLTNARKVSPVLARLKKRSYDLVISHGNGPQVGLMLVQNERSRDVAPPMPLFALVAMSQGQIGLVLQTALEQDLIREGQNETTTTTTTNQDNSVASSSSSAERVVVLGTRVVVDAPSSLKPTKPVGSYYSKEEAAKMMQQEGKTMVEDKARGGWRVVVPSPVPRSIVELETIKTLLDEGKTVIACGGGGVPVFMSKDSSGGELTGVDAVIDKDLASALLASLIPGCNELVILTDVDAVYLDFNDAAKRRAVAHATPEELQKWISEKQFAAGSMLPKVEAVMSFVTRNPNGTAYITSIERLEECLSGRAGTRIANASKQQAQQQIPECTATIRVVASATQAAASKRQPRRAWRASAEWSKPDRILMYTPNSCGELLIPTLHAASALFESSFDPDAAASDHLAFQQLLQERTGAEIVLLKDLLCDKAALSPKWLQRLRNLAKSTVRLDLSQVDEDEHTEHRLAVHDAIDKLSATRVFDHIVTGATIRLGHNDTNTHQEAQYRIAPLMNLYFQRDQMITTARGVVLGKMSSVQRRAETGLTRLALDVLMEEEEEEAEGDHNKHHHNILHQVTDDGRLEGGDFFSLGDFAFLGQGLRTNDCALQQLLQADAFGSRYVVAVKDKYRHQSQMHLDCYFNVCGSKTCLLAASRLSACREQDTVSPFFTSADIYERKSSGLTAASSYRKIKSDINFLEALNHAGFGDSGGKIIAVSAEDQLNYGCNHLCIGEKEVILVKRGEDGLSRELKRELTDAGVGWTEVEMTALSAGFGAAHCCTNVSRL